MGHQAHPDQQLDPAAATQWYKTRQLHEAVLHPMKFPHQHQIASGQLLSLGEAFQHQTVLENLRLSSAYRNNIARLGCCSLTERGVN